MNNQKADSKASDHHDEGDHTQPINLVAARTVAPATFSGTSTAVAAQPLAMRSHVEPNKPGLMTLYFRTPTPRPQGQVMGPVVGTQVSSTSHFTAKQAQDFKNSNISSWTVIRMPTSDISQGGTTTASSSSTITPGILPSALSGTGRHMIPAAVHPVIAGSSGQSMASIIRSSHQGPQTGHVIHQSFSSHVPRGPAAVASISAAPKSAVATPILRTPHSSTTMALASSSMMSLHTPIRAKSPTLANRTATPPVNSSSLSQVVDLQKSNIGHSFPSSNTTHIGLGARTLDGSVVRSGPSHSSSITIAKSINMNQPIVQHLQQVHDKTNLKTVSSLSSTTSAASNSTPVHPTSASSFSESGVISRTTVSSGYSTSIMQLSTAVNQPSLQTLRAPHQAMHSLSGVTTSGTPHQTLTVISAKSLMPTNHSIALATPARSATPITSASGNASIIPSSSSRPHPTANSINPATIPVAKVYPQSPATSRTISESSNSSRAENFVTQSVVSGSRISTTTTASNSGPQSVMITEKQTDNNPSIRFTSLSKSHAGSTTTYAPSSATYLYHDQYSTNLPMHQYTTNPSAPGFTTQLRPVSFSQHNSSNSSSHTPMSSSGNVQPINSVMVAVDSRHHVALHPSFGKGAEMSSPSSNGNAAVNSNSTPVVTTSYNTLQSQGNVNNNHTSPRPSILRKRTAESVSTVAKKNLTSSLVACSDPISPRPDSSSISFASVLSPKPSSDKIREAPPIPVPMQSETSNSSSIIQLSAIKKEPGILESVGNNLDSIKKESCPIEASPRKKPRKQLLAANELMETHSSEGDENGFESKVKVKEEMDEERSKCITFKRPNMSLLNMHRQPWKARHNHFIRHSDVKPKEEKKPTVNELANQKGIVQHINGWKVYHLSAQMEEIIELEETVHSKLSHLLDFIEKSSQRGKSLNSDEDRIINKLTDLIKGNLQRSKIVQEQVTESKQQAIKVLDHKSNVAEMVNKYVSRRPLKKKDKS